MADGILLDNDVIFDNDNAALADGSVTIYETGTTTLVTLYSDAAGTTPTTNPIELDGSGRAPKVFVTTSTTLDAVIRDKNGALVRTNPTLPRVGQSASSAASVSIDPIIGVNDPATWPSAAWTGGDPQLGTPAADVQTGLEALAGRITPFSAFMEFEVLRATTPTAARTVLELGTFAVLDEADRTLSQSVWNTGTSTTEGLISPAKMEAKLADYTSAIETASSGQLSIAADASLTWTHGITAPVKVLSFELVCITADGIFSPADRVPINPASNHTDATAATNGIVALNNSDGTIDVYCGAAIQIIAPGGAGAPTRLTIDFAKWELVIHAMTF
jgi:hypothetical protein